MADTKRYASLYDLASRLTESLDLLEQDVMALPDEGAGRDLYIEYQHRFSHVRSLFDQAADLFRDVTFDQTNPELHEVLECKKGVDQSYGRYRRLSNHFNRLHDKGERDRDELARERVMEAPLEDIAEDLPEPEPDMEAIPDQEEDFDAALLAAQLEEEAQDEAEKKERQRANRRRQESLARDAKAREEAFHKQEEAQRSSSYTAPSPSYDDGPQFSAANERLDFLRREEEARLAAEAARQRLADEQAAMERYRQRMEQSQQFDASQKSHFDFSTLPNEPAVPVSSSEPDTQRSAPSQADYSAAAQPTPTHKSEESYFADPSVPAPEDPLRHQAYVVSPSSYREEPQFSAANERLDFLRREDEARLAAEAARRRLEEQQAAMDNYRRRMEQSQQYDASQKGHFDFSTRPNEQAGTVPPSEPYTAGPASQPQPSGPSAPYGYPNVGHQLHSANDAVPAYDANRGGPQHTHTEPANYSSGPDPLKESHRREPYEQPYAPTYPGNTEYPHSFERRPYEASPRGGTEQGPQSASRPEDYRPDPSTPGPIPGFVPRRDPSPATSEQAASGPDRHSSPVSPVQPSHVTPDSHQGVAKPTDRDIYSHDIIPEPEVVSSHTTPTRLFRYVPSGAAEWKVQPHSAIPLILNKALDGEVSDNKKIYATLKAGIPEDKAGPYPISPAYETQMRFNLEKARMDFKAKYGTPEATAALLAYQEQRKAFTSFRADVMSGRIQVEKPKVMDGEAAHRQEPPREKPKQNASSVQYFYKPTGIYGRLIENAQVSGSRCDIKTPGTGKPRPFQYTAANPLVVSPMYEEMLKSRVDCAGKLINQAAAMTKARGCPVRIAPMVNNEVASSAQAYTNFLRAKQSGQVVVSKDSNRDMPDFNLWSERYFFARSNGSVIPVQGTGRPLSGGVGGGRRPLDETTFQSKGVNPNVANKEAVEERVANIFGKSVKLKRETAVAHMAKNVGYRMEGWGMTAVARASRKLYSMAQAGNEDGPETLRTFEQGRYYLMTTAGLAVAIKNFHVVDSKGALHSGSKAEKLHYSKFLDMGKRELNDYTNNLIDSNRALKREIKDLMKRGASLTPAERTELLEKTKKLALDSREASRAKGFQKMQKRNANAVNAAKDLEGRRHVLTSRKQVDKAIKEIRTKGEAAMAKKFGSLTHFTEKSLKRKVQVMKEQGRELKAEIKLLQSRGSSLTFEERKYLKKLMDKHADLNGKLRRYIGLMNARSDLQEKINAYMHLRKDIMKNANAFVSGLWALHSLMLKPIREGSEVGAMGLAHAANIVTNRHVRKIVFRIIKTEYKLTRWKAKMLAKPVKWAAHQTGADVATKAAVNATKKFVVNSKPVRVAKAGTEAVSNLAVAGAHKAAAATHTAVAYGKTAVVKVTPQFVKTGVRKAVAGRTLVQNSLARAKNRVANSVFGRAGAAIHRTFSKVSQGLKTAFTFAKTFLIKAGLSILGFILAFGLVVSAVEIITSAVSSVIMAPEGEDGKIDLKPYVDILRGEQAFFENQIKAIQNDPDYDKVIVEYLTTTTDNTRELLSMMAVRMSQDLDMSTNTQVEPYLRSIFNDTHFYTTKKTYFKCVDGCKTREHKRDHTYGVCPEDCEEDHGVIIERYCDGDHIRVDVKVSILGFDEIFSADSMGNAQGDVSRGDLIGRAMVTYYCTEKYPHICNAGPPYKTALGTTPTPGRTIAVDPNIIPLGTHVLIDGHEYVAEDTGGAIDGLRVDIVVKTHEEALAKGKRTNVSVYKVSYEGEGIQSTGEWNGWTDDNKEWCKTIYYTDWSDLYDGIEGIPNVVGLDTDLSGVQFVNGSRPGNQNIVNIAKSQQGVVGGQPYWSWYGFDSRVEWCACFVSWCAYKDGALYDSVPKFAACQTQGIPWFKDHGQWAKRGDITPVAGDIIFFDWEPDGASDHVGIVVGSDESKVYTVEGNSGDRVRIKSYPLNSPYILGYGIPNY